MIKLFPLVEREPITISIWHGYIETEEETFSQAVTDFLAANPHIKIDVLAVPKPKRPEFFSLATPVRIRGSFSDFGIGINKLSLAKTAVSFVTSPVTVPFKRLFTAEVPADGKRACEQAWGRTPAQP